jgi:hypothetical protein
VPYCITASVWLTFISHKRTWLADVHRLLHVGMGGMQGLCAAVDDAVCTQWVPPSTIHHLRVATGGVCGCHLELDAVGLSFGRQPLLHVWLVLGTPRCTAAWILP